MPKTLIFAKDDSHADDLRTNVHFTLKENPLRREHLDDFVACYQTGDCSKSVESERFHQFTYDKLVARDKTSLEDLQAALAEFTEVAASLAALAYPNGANLRS